MKGKGAYYERKALKLLESEGWLCERARAITVWIKGQPRSIKHDFFGLYDIIAVKARKLRFIQVKFLGENSHGSIAEVKEELMKFPHPGELWVYRKQENGKVVLDLWGWDSKL
jgi:Holliday junction resolvase-like predicted endonuclease